MKKLTPHPQAEILCAIAQGKQIQVRHIGYSPVVWDTVPNPLVFIGDGARELRIKPEVILINNIEVPEPVRERLNYGTPYFKGVVMKNLTEVLQYWLQGQINDAVAGHSSRIAYLEGFVSSLSERLDRLEKVETCTTVPVLEDGLLRLDARLLKLEKAYPDMATTKDLLKDTDPSVLVDRLHEHIEQIVGGKLGECVKEVHLEENVEAILDRRSQASDDDKRDAQRYRWLREQHWSDNVVGIVRHPGEVLKLGTVCYSDASLDRLIDEALAKEQV